MEVLGPKSARFTVNGKSVRVDIDAQGPLQLIREPVATINKIVPTRLKVLLQDPITLRANRLPRSSGMKTHWLAVALLFAAAGLAHADVKLPAMFADNMVLQADAKIPVFGTAAPNEAITVTLRREVGKDPGWCGWQMARGARSSPGKLHAAPARGLRHESSHVQERADRRSVDLLRAIEHVLQPAKDDNAATEVPKATDPNLRLLKVPEQAALQPQDDLRGRWMVCDPKSVGAFSAVAYYFGRQLRQKLDRPVGLIESAWGGSSIQAWMSIDALQKAPPFTQDIAVYQKWLSGDAAREAAYPQQFAAYNAALKKWQAEVEAPYQATLVHWQSDDDTAKQNHQPEPSKPAPPRGPPKPLPPGGDRSIFTTPFNAMIAPLLHCGFKGVLWYQGESNAGAPRQRVRRDARAHDHRLARARRPGRFSFSGCADPALRRGGRQPHWRHIALCPRRRASRAPSSEHRPRRRPRSGTAASDSSAA